MGSFWGGSSVKKNVTKLSHYIPYVPALPSILKVRMHLPRGKGLSDTIATFSWRDTSLNHIICQDVQPHPSCWQSFSYEPG